MLTQRELGHSGSTPGQSLINATLVSPSVTKSMEEHADLPTQLRVGGNFVVRPM